MPLCWQLKGVPGCPLVPVLLVAFLLSFAFFSLVVSWLGAAPVATLCSDSCRTHMPGSSVWFFLGFFLLCVLKEIFQADISAVAVLIAHGWAARCYYHY